MVFYSILYLYVIVILKSKDIKFVASLCEYSHSWLGWIMFSYCENYIAFCNKPIEKYTSKQVSNKLKHLVYLDNCLFDK